MVVTILIDKDLEHSLSRILLIFIFPLFLISLLASDIYTGQVSAKDGQNNYITKEKNPIQFWLWNLGTIIFILVFLYYGLKQI